jgi:photosystem II stability/assembly factor-like uncharacterized protein
MSRDFRDDELGRSEFDRRLRDVLHSRALSISPDADALDRIHAGARRRQRRHRAAVSGGAALAVIAVAAVGVTLRPAHHSGSQLAGAPSSNVESTARETLNAPAPLTTPASPVASSAAPSQTVHQSIGGPAALPAGGAPPAGFVPISVTATSGSTYWVLGHAPCDAGTCVGIAKTTDGGKTFTEVGAPTSKLAPDAVSADTLLGTDTISDVRFVSANDGWAYGGGLWQTTDGGQQWSRYDDPTAPIEGPVQQLAVASGHAWAIAFANKAGGTPTYQLYTATYPNGSWAPALKTVFGPAEPMLSVQGTTVTVIGTESSTGKPTGFATTDGQRFTALPADLPCASSSQKSISSTPQGLWVACPTFTGTLGGAYFSPDFGKSWQVATSSLGVQARTVTIGGVDRNSAIVATGSELSRINADGSTTAVATPSVPSSTTFAFIGFTTTDDGFAIPVVDGTRQLWRTTDGGDHWSVVKF